MKKILLTLTIVAIATVSFAQKNTKANTNKTNTASLTLKNETDSISYALGVLVGKNLKSQGFDVIDLEKFKTAIREVFDNKTPVINETQCQTEVQAFAMEQMKVKAEKSLKEGQAFLEKNKTRPGVKVLPSGLQYEVINAGDPNGPKPTLTSQVSVHYHGTLLDGTIFDSSVDRGQPYKTTGMQVIKAWQEALVLMTPGTKIRIWSPAELAYGERGNGPKIGPNQVLVFEMELMSIDKP